MTTAAELEQPKAATKAETEFYVRPRYTSQQVEGGYEVRVVMPGVNRESVDVNLEKDTVTVTGKRVNQAPKEWKLLHRESNGHNYRLQLHLNFDLNAEAVSAKVEDGVLTDDAVLSFAEETLRAFIASLPPSA